MMKKERLLSFLLIFIELIWITMSNEEKKNYSAWQHYCLFTINMNDNNEMQRYPMLNNTCIELKRGIPPGKASITGHGGGYDIISDWVFGAQVYGNNKHWPSKIKYYGDDACNSMIMYQQDFFYKTQFNQMTIYNHTIIELTHCDDVYRLSQRYKGTKMPGNMRPRGNLQNKRSKSKSKSKSKPNQYNNVLELFRSVLGKFF